MFKQLFGLISTSTRAPQWPTVRAGHLLIQPYCRACGVRKRLEVHHIEPVQLHEKFPTKFAYRELDPTNWITLCETPSHNCHEIFGHLLSFEDSWNPNVVADAAAFLIKVLQRPSVKGLIVANPSNLHT